MPCKKGKTKPNNPKMIKIIPTVKTRTFFAFLLIAMSIPPYLIYSKLLVEVID